MAVHFVAVPWVIPGHINPLLHLCTKLVALGSFRITFVNTIQNHQRMFHSQDAVTRDGIDFVAVSDGLQENAPDGQPPAGMDGLKEVILSTAGMQPGVKELVRSMVSRGIEIKGIVSDTFVHWTQELADEFKLVRVIFSPPSATFDLVTLHMRRFRTEGFLPVNSRTTGDKLIEFMPGMPGFSPFDLCLAWYEEHPAIDFCILPYECFFKAEWILSGTFQALEPDKVSIFHEHYGFKNYLPVGPFLPDEHVSGSSSTEGLDLASSSPDEVRSLQWLDSRPKSSVLYVAFGSIATMSSDQFQELLLALDSIAKSGICNILWAVRENFVEGDFPREMFDAFLEKNGEKVCVVSWAAQLRVLRHGAVAGFVTHCGWNSTLEGICAGVPMIAWPSMSEQNMNCSFLSKMKMVLPLRDYSTDAIVEKKQIFEAVETLLRGEVGKEIKSRVTEMKMEARKAVASGGSSYKNLETFVKAMLA